MQAVTGAPDKINKQTEVKNPVGDDNNFKVLGFCGTVAGWSAPICKTVCDWLAAALILETEMYLTVLSTNPEILPKFDTLNEIK